MNHSRLSGEEIAAIAEEAYIFSFPMLMGTATRSPRSPKTPIVRV